MYVATVSPISALLITCLVHLPFRLPRSSFPALSVSPVSSASCSFLSRWKGTASLEVADMNKDAMTPEAEA